jgi:hypothetical protein
MATKTDEVSARRLIGHIPFTVKSWTASRSSGLNAASMQ